jgi:hypothetical protein
LKTTRAEYWAPRIAAEWRKSVEGILGVGRQLIAAKKACEHGEFLRLFKGHENAVSDPVPFSERTAERLIAVASHAVISNPTHVSDLPQSWGTLYELTKLDDETLIAGIKAGKITPETTRTQAASLHADPVEKPEKPPHEEMASAVKNAVTKFAGQLTTRNQFTYVRKRLESLVSFISEMEAQINADTDTANGTAGASAESAAVELHDAIYRVLKEGNAIDALHGELLHEHWLRLNATLYDEPLSPRRITWASDADTISEFRNAADYAAGIQGKPEKMFRALRLSAQRVRKALAN